jgi:DNA-binding transcriptional regulator YiaG
VRRKKKYKPKSFKPIDQSDFKDLRKMNSLTIEQAATMLHVTPRTVSSWERGATRIPYSAYKLFRLLANGEFLSGAWEGWRVRADTLYTPTGRAFKPHQLYYLSNYMTMAHYWLAESKQRQRKAQVVLLRPKLTIVTKATTDEGAA